MGTLLFYTFFHQSLLYENYNRNIAMPHYVFLYIESFLDLRNVPSSLLWIHLLWRYFIGSGTHQLESIIEKNVIVAR